MSGRPHRAALHQRSDSETNEIRTIPSIHSNNSSVSEKAIHVSSWVTHPTTASISRDSTRSGSRTASASKIRGGTGGSLRQSGSLDSLPPIAPLKINKRKSTFIVARDLATTAVREPLSSDILTGLSNSSPDAAAIKTQTFPKSILKKPSRVALPPYSSAEYNQKSSSWIRRNSSGPRSGDRISMNTTTLRIVHSEDSVEEGGEGLDFIGGLTGRERSVSGTLCSNFQQPSSPGSDAQTIPTSPKKLFAALSPSTTSVERPGTAGSLFASAKQFPAWARYFYGKKGGRGSIIEPDIPSRSNVQYGQGISTVNPGLRRPPSDNSLVITEVSFPGRAYGAPRPTVSAESIPGLDWIGSRTKIMDPEIATQWSTPHLDNTPLSRFENIDRQLIMFCLGFVLPVCWVVASFLPLPKFHIPIQKESRLATSQSPSYNASSYRFPERRRYENARWWRRVNRALSGLGLAMIGAIITLVVVAAKHV